MSFIMKPPAMAMRGAMTHRSRVSCQPSMNAITKPPRKVQLNRPHVSCAVGEQTTATTPLRTYKKRMPRPSLSEIPSLIVRVSLPERNSRAWASPCT